EGRKERKKEKKERKRKKERKERGKEGRKKKGGKEERKEKEREGRKERKREGQREGRKEEKEKGRDREGGKEGRKRKGGKEGKKEKKRKREEGRERKKEKKERKERKREGETSPLRQFYILMLGKAPPVEFCLIPTDHMIKIQRLGKRLRLNDRCCVPRSRDPLSRPFDTPKSTGKLDAFEQPLEVEADISLSGHTEYTSAERKLRIGDREGNRPGNTQLHSVAETPSRKGLFGGGGAHCIVLKVAEFVKWKEFRLSTRPQSKERQLRQTRWLRNGWLCGRGWIWRPSASRCHNKALCDEVGLPYQMAVPNKQEFLGRKECSGTAAGRDQAQPSPGWKSSFLEAALLRSSFERSSRPTPLAQAGGSTPEELKSTSLKSGQV
ncbi:Splicing regulatory glutamine/lysine-rich protein 1, partial [Ophiophagus hannah]